MAVLINLLQGAECQKSGGVLPDMRIARVSDINLGTTAKTANVITTWAMNGSEVFGQLEVSGKDSFYEGTYTYDDGTIKPTITAVFKYKTPAQILAIDNLKGKCNLVLCVRAATEDIWRVFGLEVDASTTLVGSRIEGLRVDSIIDNSFLPNEKTTVTVTFICEQYNLPLFATDTPPLV